MVSGKGLVSGDEGVYGLNTKHKQWTLAKAPDMVPSSTTGCTFPPRQGLRLRSLSTQDIAEPRPPFFQVMAIHLLIHPRFHKYLLNSFCVPGTVLALELQ